MKTNLEKFADAIHDIIDELAHSVDEEVSITDRLNPPFAKGKRLGYLTALKAFEQRFLNLRSLRIRLDLWSFT